jgi:hypothetical protein
MNKKGGLFIIAVIVVVALVAIFIFNFDRFTGKVVSDSGFGGGSGPTPSEIACMQACVSVGCEQGDAACANANSGACGQKCGVDTQEPEPKDEGEACMQDCVKVGCSDYDFSCQEANKPSCEDECGMKGDAPDESEMSEEERCIFECVSKHDPSTICGASQEGETGNDVCQMCADQCVHLYEGPCLMEEELESKEKECQTCEHCYGEPVMGPSGQGWDCIVDVECKDASGEFGDEPGEGPGIGQEGFVANVVESIGNFFSNLFGGE